MSVFRSPAGRELLRLLDPAITIETALHAVDVGLDPHAFERRPGGDLIEVPDAVLVELLLQLFGDAPDQGKIVAFAIARRGKQRGTLTRTRARR